MQRAAISLARRGLASRTAARAYLPIFDSVAGGARSSSSSSPSSPAASARQAALLTAIKQIEHSFGKLAVQQLGARAAPAAAPDAVSSGSLSLDLALGVGGFPRGRVVEIYGPESSGKTTLALHAIAEAQKRGLSACFVDAEHALDARYAARVGVDLDRLYVAQPDTGEQALEIVDTLVRSGGMDIVVVDSVAALVPRAELEGEMGDSHMALQARLMSQALRKLTASLGKTRTLIIFINQIRSKVGVVFGSPDITSGGNALKFYASIRCEIRRSSVIKDGETPVGSMVRVKVAKNKLAPPFRVAEFEMGYGSGISRVAEAVDLGAQFGVLKKSGAFYSVVDEALAAAMNSAAAAGEGAAAAGAAGAGASATAAATAGPVEAVPPVVAKKGKRGAKTTELPAAAIVIGGPGSDAVLAPTAPEAAAAAPAAPGMPRAPILQAGSPFAQGREKAKAFLEAHPAALDVLIAAVRKAIFAGGALPAIVAEAGADE